MHDSDDGDYEHDLKAMHRRDQFSDLEDNYMYKVIYIKKPDESDITLENLSYFSNVHQYILLLSYLPEKYWNLLFNETKYSHIPILLHIYHTGDTVIMDDVKFVNELITYITKTEDPINTLRECINILKGINLKIFLDTFTSRVQEDCFSPDQIDMLDKIIHTYEEEMCTPPDGYSPY